MLIIILQPPFEIVLESILKTTQSVLSVHNHSNPDSSPQDYVSFFDHPGLRFKELLNCKFKFINFVIIFTFLISNSGGYIEFWDKKRAMRA